MILFGRTIMVNFGQSQTKANGYICIVVYQFFFGLRMRTVYVNLHPSNSGSQREQHVIDCHRSQRSIPLGTACSALRLPELAPIPIHTALYAPSAALCSTIHAPCALLKSAYAFVSFMSLPDPPSSIGQ